MKSTSLASIESHFASLPYPRTGPAQRHNFIDILVIAICAIICGADGWVAVEAFGKAKYDWMKSLLQLPNGVPSHDTFTRVFRALNPQQLATMLFRLGKDG